MNIEVGDIFIRNSLGRVIKIVGKVDNLYQVEVIKMGSSIIKPRPLYSFYTILTNYTKQEAKRTYKIV